MSCRSHGYAIAVRKCSLPCCPNSAILFGATTLIFANRHSAHYFTGKLCIEVTSASKIAWISESLCIGCGICVKKCPMEALQIINLPKNLEKDTTHRYGANQFKLHRLPTPRAGEVLGLVGTNGIGKSTALKVLAGKTKPNLGRFDVRQCFRLLPS